MLVGRRMTAQCVHQHTVTHATTSSNNLFTHYQYSLLHRANCVQAELSGRSGWVIGKPPSRVFYCSTEKGPYPPDIHWMLITGGSGSEPPPTVSSSGNFPDSYLMYCCAVVSSVENWPTDAHMQHSASSTLATVPVCVCCASVQHCCADSKGMLRMTVKMPR
jgi:hypothetical protein